MEGVCGLVGVCLVQGEGGGGRGRGIIRQNTHLMLGGAGVLHHQARIAVPNRCASTGARLWRERGTPRVLVLRVGMIADIHAPSATTNAMVARRRCRHRGELLLLLLWVAAIPLILPCTSLRWRANMGGSWCECVGWGGGCEWA